MGDLGVRTFMSSSGLIMDPPSVDFIRSRSRPAYEAGDAALRAVDLFAGAGGMSLGLAEAAREHDLAFDLALAVEFDASIAAVLGANFPKAEVLVKPVESLFDGDLGEELTEVECAVVTGAGRVQWLQGGPPCQGHSDLNNKSRRMDPRNGFYLRMARAAEILEPSVVVIENVPGVTHDKSRVVDRAVEHLEALGFDVAHQIVSLESVGVPQRRRRHTLLGLTGLSVSAAGILADLGSDSVSRDLRWAIGDLTGRRPSPFDVPSKTSSENARRIAYLHTRDVDDLPNSLRPPCHQGDHTYRSMYGRMRWDEPAQTITTGFGSMGQGRYVHPSERRTLTPHEAARIQFFPDWFDFTAGGFEMRRRVWATMIGNAVPPKLTMELGRLLIPHLLTRQ